MSTGSTRRSQRVRPTQSRRASIVGAFGGYEKLDFEQENAASDLDGNGRTAGIYAAWMLAPKLRLDGAIARTWLDYEATAGTASGDFDGSRWLFLTRLSGDHLAGRWTFTPSAEVFWLHETQDAYTDSLGTAQAKNSFTNGRANAGLQAAYAIPLSQRTTLSPYAGIYADYYFGMEDDGTALSVIGIGDGWAARATGGLDALRHRRLVAHAWRRSRQPRRRRPRVLDRPFGGLGSILSVRKSHNVCIMRNEGLGRNAGAFSIDQIYCPEALH